MLMLLAQVQLLQEDLVELVVVEMVDQVIKLEELQEMQVLLIHPCSYLP